MGVQELGNSIHISDCLCSLEKPLGAQTHPLFGNAASGNALLPGFLGPRRSHPFSPETSLNSACEARLWPTTSASFGDGLCHLLRKNPRPPSVPAGVLQRHLAQLQQVQGPVRSAGVWGFPPGILEGCCRASPSSSPCNR